MSVSPRSLSVSATTTQSAPSTAFTVYVNGLSLNQVVYLNTPFSGQGISQVINHGGNLPAYVPVALDPPANLGPGTYVGVVHVSVCIDQACTQLAANSPEDVQVTYTVTRSTFATVGLSPSSAYAGSQGFTLAVNGATFTPQSSVLWDGTAIHSTYVNSNQLVADVPAGQIATAGTATVTVYDPTNGTSNAQSFTIKPSPIAITSLSPVSPAAGGPAFTLTVTGTGFTSQSSVLWNGASLATTFVSATKLSAPIPASDITTPGTDAVAVADPVFGVSDSKTLTVVPAPLALSSVSPKTVTVGGPAFTLTAIGSSFTGTSVVQWNGVALTTTVVSSTELTAQVPAGDVGAVGTASVRVSDPNSPPATTASQTVTVASPTIDAVSFQLNPAHTGAVTFPSVSFPTSAAWSVDVGGTPSYALITHGKVIVTVRLSSGASELLALDQATGVTVWGPIPLSSASDPTYDDGRVFVLSGSSSAILEAFDVDTGAMDWSTTLTGRIVFTSLLTATQDIVFVGTEGQVDAVAESDGTLLWNRSVDGTTLAPAATVDGIYTSFSCTTTDLRPATGEVIWSKNSGCSGGGGGPVPVVANQLLYGPNASFGYNGEVFAAESGANDGTYAADAPPAITASMGFFMQGGTLKGMTLSDNTLRWSFTGDGHLVGAPIAVNNYVFIGSSSGNLYAVDSASTGTVTTPSWTVNLGSAIVTGVSTLQYSGLAAGDGLLVVPSGTKVTAYKL